MKVGDVCMFIEPVKSKPEPIMPSVLPISYHTAQNFGRENFGEFGETNAIQQYFTQPNSRFTKANVSYCKFINILLAKTHKTIDLPKFYPAKILCHMVFLQNFHPLFLCHHLLFHNVL